MIVSAVAVLLIALSLLITAIALHRRRMRRASRELGNTLFRRAGEGQKDE